MKTILTVISLAFLTACGGTMQPTEDAQKPSTQKAVPCEQSKECMSLRAANTPIRTCAESFAGTPAVMMSTWDNGVTWVKGNCDSTAM